MSFIDGRQIYTTFRGQRIMLKASASLASLYEATARKFPDRIALSAGDTDFSYDQLGRRAQLVAEMLARLGVTEGDRVGLAVDRSVDSVAAMLGILFIGAAYVPLDPDLPSERLRFIAQDAGLRVVVGGQFAIANVLVEVDRHAVPQPTGKEPRFSGHSPDSGVLRGNQLAYVLYTSGSTGRPKGCMVSHANVISLLRACETLFDFHPSDVWSLFHSASFDFAVWELWGAFAHGARGVMVPKSTAQSPELMVDLLIRENVTVLNQVPSAFRHLVGAIAERGLVSSPNSLRYVIFGGESVDLASVRLFWESFDDASRPSVINMYGITEVTVHASFKELLWSDLLGDVGSPIGRVLPHLQVQLRDEHGNEVVPGQVGEMWLAGPAVCAGYINLDRLTEERFVTIDGSRFFKTGDLVIEDRSGYLNYVGRRDQQAKHLGFRIDLLEIERLLCKTPDVREALATALVDKHGNDLLIAVFCSRSGDSLSVVDLRRELRPMLPSYAIPNRFIQWPALPVTATGKLDRREVARRLSATVAN